MVKIISYQSVGGVDFGSNESVALSVFGVPERKGVNREGEGELYFHDFILRFDSMARGLRECKLLPKCIAEINGVPVDWDGGFLRWLISQGCDLKEVYGFVVSLKLGLAATGLHDDDDSQRAVHAFGPGDWDLFKGKMTPFFHA